MPMQNAELIAQYRETLDAIVAGVNEQDISEFDGYFADDLQTDIPFGWSGEYISSFDDLETFFGDYFEAFPDFELELESFYADGEWTFCWLSFSGTHEGDFWGFEPSGESFSTTGFWINRFDGDQISESYGWFDYFDLLCQLGYEFSFEN
ncbi:ester cyclase [Haloarchaeobius sp. TZWWS8]|uniref:ester cyclase n=1 Tax=Haloarchaeobius sp. TZWWS8 TaxID=3446121 RepID=UPI003EBBB246